MCVCVAHTRTLYVFSVCVGMCMCVRAFVCACVRVLYVCACVRCMCVRACVVRACVRACDVCVKSNILKKKK